MSSSVPVHDRGNENKTQNLKSPCQSEERQPFSFFQECTHRGILGLLLNIVTVVNVKRAPFEAPPHWKWLIDGLWPRMARQAQLSITVSHREEEDTGPVCLCLISPKTKCSVLRCRDRRPAELHWPKENIDGWHDGT